MRLILKAIGIFSLVLTIGMVNGCSFNRKIEPPKGRTSDQLYKEGMSQLKSKDYRQAVETFYKLKYDYPTEAAAMLADLKIADAYFSDKKYAEAIESYEDFRKMHPASPYIPYAVYMLGLCHYEKMHSIDRDQTNTERALSEFKYLLTHFPNTPYAWDASEKIKECMQRLSDHEVYVGSFYFRMKKYRAAIQRFEAALTRFPSIPLQDDVLFDLGEAYRRTEQYDKALRTWQALVKQYPKSKSAKKARSRLAKLPDAGVTMQASQASLVSSPPNASVSSPPTSSPSPPPPPPTT
jgi:outer membrane protein assembly factor BamD